MGRAQHGALECHPKPSMCKDCKKTRPLSTRATLSDLSCPRCVAHCTGCFTGPGMSGGAAWERIVVNGTTASRVIRGIVSYNQCGPRTPTCDCCAAGQTSFAVQMTSAHVLNIRAWAAMN
jgi:hypothetical protein